MEFRSKSQAVTAQRFTEPTFRGAMYLGPGDWLVTHASGAQEAMKDAEFQRRFEAVPAKQISGG